MGAKGTLLVLLIVSVVLGLLRSDLTGKLVGRQKLQLSFWNGWTGPDGRVALEMIREFNKENPDVQVSMQRMDWATYYNKLMVAESDMRGPEIFVIHASTLPRMRQAGFVADVSDLLRGPDAIPEADFDPYVLNQVRYGSEIAGIPLDIHPQGMYCNAEMLRRIGFVDAHGRPRPPANGQEFLKAAKEMQRNPDAHGDPEEWGFALTMWRNNFQSLIPQFGGRYLDANGRADLENPGNVAALSFLQSIETNHLAPPPENGLGWVGFRQKKVGMVWDGVYMLGDLKRLDDFQAVGAPIPQIGPKPGTMADSHVLCVQKGLDPARRDAAERFLRFFSAHSIEWAGAGQVPARKSVRSNPLFAAMPIQSAFAKQIPYMMYPPRTTVLFELTLEIDVAVEKVLRGRATPLQALQAADVNVQKAIDREAAERSVK